jgi:hypothetical protein
VTCAGARQLVQHGEAAADAAAGSAVVFDAARQIFTEARVQKIIVIPDLETRLGKEIREVSFQVSVQMLKTGPRVAVSRHFALLHFRFDTSVANAKLRRREWWGSARYDAIDAHASFTPRAGMTPRFFRTPAQLIPQFIRRPAATSRR